MGRTLPHTSYMTILYLLFDEKGGSSHVRTDHRPKPLKELEVDELIDIFNEMIVEPLAQGMPEVAAMAQEVKKDTLKIVFSVAMMSILSLILAHRQVIHRFLSFYIITLVPPVKTHDIQKIALQMQGDFLMKYMWQKENN